MTDQARAATRRLVAWPPAAHHLDAFQRANGLRFTRWAAAIALFAYLSLFPLIALAFIVFGLVLSSHPDVKSQVESALQDNLPLLFSSDGGQDPIDIASVAESTLSAGTFAVLGLLIAGLGWVDATVEGTRRMLGALRRPRNFLALRLEDAIGLIAAGSLLLTAFVISLGVRSAGAWVLGLFDVEISSSWLLTLSADAVVVALVWVVLVAFYGLSWSRPQRRWSKVCVAALMASVCLGVLSQFSYLIVGRTLDNPVYGTLAVAAAMLFFLYVVSIVHLYFACWLAIAEGAPITSEQVAYRKRRQGRGIGLPTTEEVAPSEDAANG